MSAFFLTLVASTVTRLQGIYIYIYTITYWGIVDSFFVWFAAALTPMQSVKIGTEVEKLVMEV